MMENNIDYEKVTKHLQKYGIKPLFINLDIYFTDHYVVWKCGEIIYKEKQVNGVSKIKIITLSHYRTTKEVLEKIDKVLGGNMNKYEFILKVIEYICFTVLVLGIVVVPLVVFLVS